MSKTTLKDANNPIVAQLDMGDTSGGLQGGGEAVSGFFDLMKGASESFGSLSGCSSNCVGSSFLSHNSEVVVSNSDGLLALSISEQLYELSAQVLILTALIVLFIVVSLVKPYVLYKISQKKKSIARRK